MDPGQRIAFISDVGAERLKPLFIAMSTVTILLLNFSIMADRWLRHQKRLAATTHTSEKVLSWFAIVFAWVGGAGLILLSIFDTLRHPRLHDGFLVMFIGGYIVSAIFLCAEFQRLGIHQRDKRIIATSFWIKLTFIIIEVALAIAFGLTHYKGSPNAAAILEWVVALVYTFWVLSFLIDLLPAVKTKHHNAEDADAPQLEFGGPQGGVHLDHGRTNNRYSGYGVALANAGTNEYEHSRGSTLVSGGSDGAFANGAPYTNGGFRPGRKSPGPAVGTAVSGGLNGPMAGEHGTWLDHRDGAHHPARNF